ncbi:hypothetical protein GQ44DRAFT_185990 [Phaeosphaeriaceae sp. PMI808]|nr:hypothetical protein GQ44DRAFT_185990 [Phaeosphaeriaceae sp. PMI808]
MKVSYQHIDAKSELYSNLMDAQKKSDEASEAFWNSPSPPPGSNRDLSLENCKDTGWIRPPPEAVRARALEPRQEKVRVNKNNLTHFPFALAPDMLARAGAEKEVRREKEDQLGYGVNGASIKDNKWLKVSHPGKDAENATKANWMEINRIGLAENLSRDEMIRQVGEGLVSEAQLLLNLLDAANILFEEEQKLEKQKLEKAGKTA